MSALRSAGGKTRPEKWLNQLRCGEKPHANASTDLRSTLGTVTHSQLGPPDAPDTLRVHCVPAGLYQAAHKRAFFEPRPGTLQLFGKFNEPVKRLVAEWWNRIETSQQLFIQWSKESVHWLSTEPEARWQGHRMFLTAGITWSLHANHVAVKARFQQPCVFDASGSRLSPSRDVMSPEVFLAILNSDVFSFFLKKFIKHNQDVEINDLRTMPLVMPTKAEARRLPELAEHAMEAKRLRFTGSEAPNALVAFARDLTANLQAHAPAYLRAPAQLRLLATPTDCLEVIELAVNWEAERLYGVEGQGPFDEF